MYPFASHFSQIFLSSEVYMSLYLFYSVPSTNATAAGDWVTVHKAATVYT